MQAGGAVFKSDRHAGLLFHLIAVELKLDVKERDSLVHAALTMNIAMTAMQDQLAGQVDKPSAKQMEAIHSHSANSRLMLASLNVTDTVWLDIVSLHHDERTDKGQLRLMPPASRLARILRMVDRYAAMISPRKSRVGRSATDSVRSIISNSSEQNDEVGHALVRAVGLCPPGTYVRLDNGEVAVVMRRSAKPNLPHVAIVIDDAGGLVAQPRLHRTAEHSPKIQAALAASAVRVRLNHHLILQLGSYAAR